MRTLLFLTFFIISSNVNSGDFADYIGAYLANEQGACNSTTLHGKTFPDSNINGVCIPITAMFDEDKKSMISLAITELKHPEKLDIIVQLELAKRQPTEAFEVEVDDHDDDIFKLVDGSILEKTSFGHVGYIGYHEDAILYKDGSQWKICVDDSSYEVNILKNVRHHYSKDKVRGKSVREIEAMDICS